MKFTGTILFATVAYLATFVTADPIVSITSPLTNTHYKAGSEAVISWINPSVKTISQIVLARGKSTALQTLFSIATNVNAADMKYVWKVPYEIENGDDYAFILGTSPDLAYTGVFSIEGGSKSSPAGAGNSSVTTPASSPASAPNSPAPAGNAAAPASSSSPSSGSNSATSPHNASTSHSSAGIKQIAGQSVVAAGLVAAIAAQLV